MLFFFFLWFPSLEEELREYTIVHPLRGMSHVFLDPIWEVSEETQPPRESKRYHLGMCDSESAVPDYSFICQMRPCSFPFISVPIVSLGEPEAAWIAGRWDWKNKTRGQVLWYSLSGQVKEPGSVQAEGWLWRFYWYITDTIVILLIQ